MYTPVSTIHDVHHTWCLQIKLLQNNQLCSSAKYKYPFSSPTALICSFLIISEHITYSPMPCLYGALSNTIRHHRINHLHWKEIYRWVCQNSRLQLIARCYNRYYSIVFDSNVIRCFVEIGKRFICLLN